MQRLRLGVNIDHVATLRNARGGSHPDPVRAALLVREAGGEGITAHLREDRRHITDDDIARIRAECDLPLNFEMAATEEMLEIALATRPHACCLVPERREERTTESGLDVVRHSDSLRRYVDELGAAGIRVSLFVDASERQLEAARALGAPVVELHTGTYCEAGPERREAELERLRRAAALCAGLGLECHAGHGLTYETVAPVAALPEVAELNIGHFLIGEAVYAGFVPAVRRMRELMDAARSEAARGA
ncbi:pyridoxine 5'-phosphate synthase [Marinimicrococcus flavescens]|uniref:Pyridoxine 5'-phosphate synthase n=1 Tax=Marinimicrococcus flavescens TaxID=3031815 RepID=A0AAP3UZB3_9PROT|nr:pyridoxine 5'-phosphate synthase [Marinimicrococcus flavescens]